MCHLVCEVGMEGSVRVRMHEEVRVGVGGMGVCEVGMEGWECEEVRS